MSAETLPFLTPEEYLARERAAETRSEYYAGQMYAMSGGTEQHTLLAGNLQAELRARLRGRRCRTYVENMRVKVEPSELYTYSDVSVACGEFRFEDARRDTLLNPVLIVEVLSESTEKYTRGLKFELYRKVASLREYVLIAQDRYHIEVFTRQANGDTWLYRVFEGSESTLVLESLGCSVPLSEIYYEVELPPETGADGIPQHP